MNGTLALPNELSWTESSEHMAFLGITPNQSAKQLPGAAEGAARNIASLLDDLLMGAIEKRTSAEFNAYRDGSLGRYSALMLSVDALQRAVVAPEKIGYLTAQFLREQEAEFRESAPTVLASSIRDQGLFTIWTLRKINELSQRISSFKFPLARIADMERFTQMFVFHGMRTRFHLDCLSASLRCNGTLSLEVLSSISDGLRSAVDAYAWIRQIADLGATDDEPELCFNELDDEDREFVTASGLDLDAEAFA